MPTAVEWADVLLEFLEALVHQILYRFDVYPAASFEKRGAYALCVHRCRHPAVCDYVHAVLQDVKEPLIEGLLQELRILLSLDRSTSILRSQQALLTEDISDDEPVCSFVVRIGDLRPPEEFSPVTWEGNDVDRQQFHRILDQFRATLMRIESMKESVMDICRGPEEKEGSMKFQVCAKVFGRKAMEHAPWIIHQVPSKNCPGQPDESVQKEERDKYLMPRILPIQTIMLTRKTNVTCLIEFTRTKIEKQQKVD